MNYQKFLEDRHAQMVTPQDILEEVVVELLSDNPESFKRIIAGEINEVYEVSLKSGQVVILRVSRRLRNTFIAEKWAIDQSVAHGVPAPKVLGITSRVIGGKTRYFNIEEKLEGESFDDLLKGLDANSDEVKSWCRQVGSLLSKIHQTKTVGWGELLENLQGKYNTWSGVVENKFKAQEEIVKIAEGIDLSAELIEKAFEVIHQNFNIETHLLHHDVSPKHFFIKDNKVSGVIDFEGVWSGDPVQDLAWWDFFRGDVLPITHLYDGYENKELIEDKFDERLKMYKVYMGLEMLTWYTQIGHKGGLEHSKNQLLKLLN